MLVGQAGGLYDDGVEEADLAVQLFEGDDQVAADGAADAPVHHLDHLLIRLLRQDPLVDADLVY